MAYIVLAYVLMAYVVMAYVVMAYIVMVCMQLWPTILTSTFSIGISHRAITCSSVVLESLYIGSISASPATCLLRGYGRAGTQNRHALGDAEIEPTFFFTSTFSSGITHRAFRCSSVVLESLRALESSWS